MSPCLPTSPGSAGTLISSLPAGKLSRWCASLRIQIALRLRRLITRIPLHTPHGGGSGERRGKVFGATLRAHGTFVWALGFGGRGSDLGGLGASEGGFWCSFWFFGFLFPFSVLCVSTWRIATSVSAWVPVCMDRWGRITVSYVSSFSCGVDLKRKERVLPNRCFWFFFSLYFFSVLLWIFSESTFFDLTCSLKPLFLAR